MLPRPALLVLFAAAGLAAAASAQSRFQIKLLPAVVPGHGLTFPGGINNAGLVVGESARDQQGSNEDVRTRPVRWDRGALRELPTLAGGTGINAGANACNDHGVIVGDSPYEGGDDLAAHATVWTRTGVTDLGTLPLDGFSSATGINNRGVIVGFSGPELFFLGDNTAVRWDGGRITSLGRLPGDRDSIATAINDAGVIVGSSGDLFGQADGITRAVVWTHAGIAALPARPGDTTSQAHAINDAGVIVGSSGIVVIPGLPGPTQPVVWSGGRIRVLPLLPGDNAGEALAINRSGDVVGYSAFVDEQGFPVRQRAVAWIRGEVRDLEAGGTLPPGCSLTLANGINDHGQITAAGLCDDIYSAFLLTPARCGGH